MYKVTAIKNSKPVKVRTIEVVDGEITAVHYVHDKGKITWDFPKDLDEFKIEEIPKAIHCLDCGKQLQSDGFVVTEAYCRFNMKEHNVEGYVCNDCHFKSQERV